MHYHSKNVCDYNFHQLIKDTENHEMCAAVIVFENNSKHGDFSPLFNAEYRFVMMMLNFLVFRWGGVVLNIGLWVHWRESFLIYYKSQWMIGSPHGLRHPHKTKKSCIISIQNWVEMIKKEGAKKLDKNEVISKTKSYWYS